MLKNYLSLDPWMYLGYFLGTKKVSYYLLDSYRFNQELEHSNSP